MDGLKLNFSGDLAFFGKHKISFDRTGYTKTGEKFEKGTHWVDKETYDRLYKYSVEAKFGTVRTVPTLKVEDVVVPEPADEPNPDAAPEAVEPKDEAPAITFSFHKRKKGK